VIASYSSFTLVFVYYLFRGDSVYQLHERRAFSFCLAAIDELINGGNVGIIGITTALADVDKHIVHVR
jgi:hypothetical protein